MPLSDARPNLLRRMLVLLENVGEPGLAARLATQTYYGECPCKPHCRAVLTAPPGSSSPLMLWLEDDGEIAGQVSLNADGTMVTLVELDEDLGEPLPTAVG